MPKKLTLSNVQRLFSGGTKIVENWNPVVFLVPSLPCSKKNVGGWFHLIDWALKRNQSPWLIEARPSYLRKKPGCDTMISLPQFTWGFRGLEYFMPSLRLTFVQPVECQVLRPQVIVSCKLLVHWLLVVGGSNIVAGNHWGFMGQSGLLQKLWAVHRRWHIPTTHTK